MMHRSRKTPGTWMCTPESEEDARLSHLSQSGCLGGTEKRIGIGVEKKAIEKGYFLFFFGFSF